MSLSRVERLLLQTGSDRDMPRSNQNAEETSKPLLGGIFWSCGRSVSHSVNE